MRMNVRQHVFGLLIGLLASSSSASWSLAQSRGRLDGGGLIEVGGEEERYLRALQVAGLAPLEPWSIQPFSSSQQRRLRGQAVGMWQTHYDSETVAYANLLRPHVRVIDNSTFPLQVGGGPTWAGRGLTTEAQAGVTGAAGPIHVQLAPLAFWTQNLAFTMAPNGEQGAARFGDPRFPLNIDAPQRFGDAAYARFTMGTSRASLDIAGMTAGVSTAPQRWGPARD